MVVYIYGIYELRLMISIIFLLLKLTGSLVHYIKSNIHIKM